MNKCKRCGRPLKSEKSILLGYGKRCHDLTFKPKRKIKGYF